MKYLGISKDSRKIKPGYVYCCFEGEKQNGYDFIKQALENGASKIIGENNLEIPNYEQVKDVNLSMIEYSQKIYKNPQKKLKIIGITGTDGKTSTALLINSLLNKYTKSSYLGTNGFFIGEEEIKYSGFTTPFADELYSCLQKSVEAKSEYFVMEVSSHALVQKRIEGLEYDITIFTNLGEEHLDFHKNIEEYFQAKSQLFDKLKSGGSAIINTDDEFGNKLYEKLLKKNEKKTNGRKIQIISIGEKENKNQSKKQENPMFQISNIKTSLEQTTFEIYDTINKKKHNIISPLLATFNVYNLIQAFVTLNELDYPIQSSKTKIKNISIPGRLEVIKFTEFPTIIIDFAHTSEAIHKVMNFAKENQIKGNLWTITGSAGERDRIKRPEMGKAATDKSDYCIFTEDDPRSESVEQIIEDLSKGVKNSNCKVQKIPNRVEAIKYAISKTNELDTIILFGKGSMKLMYYDGFSVKYNEKEEVLKILNGAK